VRECLQVEFRRSGLLITASYFSLAARDALDMVARVSYRWEDLRVFVYQWNFSQKIYS
jgi:hypothetical protein